MWLVKRKFDHEVEESHLKFSALGSDDGVDRDEENHDSKPSKDGVAHCEVEEDEGEHYLEWGGPDHVQVAHEVHEPLGVHRHEVDYLSHRPLSASTVTEEQGLQKNSYSIEYMYKCHCSAL